MRFLLVLVLAALAGISGWWTVYIRGILEENKETIRQKDEIIQEKDGVILQLGDDLEESEELRRRLEVSLHLMKIDHRVARIEVLDQKPSAANPEILETTILFQDLAEDGEPIDEGQTMVLLGKKIYLESMVIKFEDSFVEGGDLLRGSSVCLFTRMFGDSQAPNEGEPIDAKGVHPHPYAGAGDGEEDTYYAELWSSFWDYANDPKLAESKGVRAMHGEAPFIETRPGKVYRVELRASGGLSIDPQ
ncbi:MAG: hypothetical protein P1V35_15895 [Planctomycetota bacterium]|nr:hypothetical protein [Planctomycetota bacterium]